MKKASELFNDIDMVNIKEVPENTIKKEDQAFLCECGSVSFAIRKDHKLECCKCGWVIEEMSWVEWDERGTNSFIQEKDYRRIKSWYCFYAEIEDTPEFWNKELKNCTHSTSLDLLEDGILNFIRIEK